jgi:hypothetical protein
MSCSISEHRWTLCRGQGFLEGIRMVQVDSIRLDAELHCAGICPLVYGDMPASGLGQASLAQYARSSLDRQRRHAQRMGEG